MLEIKEIRMDADGRARTCVDTKPLDFESSPFDHSGTSATQTGLSMPLFIKLS